MSAPPVATEPAESAGAEPVEPAVAESAPAPAESAAAEQEVAATAAAADPDRPKRRSLLARFELPILIVVAVAIAIVLKTFVMQPFYIPSESMEKTLHGCSGCSGDRILVFKPVYQVRDPHPGDIVVFRAPVDWNEAGGVTLSGNPVVHAVQWFGQLVGVVPPSEKDLVKRVIAIGGQTVKCCDSKGNVQVSDHGAAGPWRSLNEPYIYLTNPVSTTDGGATADNRTFGPVTVPSGRLWVMGDHRDDSADSRYHCGDAGTAHCDPNQSTVAVSDVIGKAVVIAWPPSRWRTLGTPATFTSALSAPLLAPGPTAPVPVAAAALVGVGMVVRRRGARSTSRRRRGVRRSALMSRRLRRRL
ncbi:signal peptidase I [Jatrophihabitans telluris]|uniref:Signal peptidase I n=1 Tax=Jatrophihabitans telluris TaxID=2038343 RepID=A0ABY4R2E8_9ACTN|nr:signal peptidase I [Jatrophihabitans telluris]UQX90004.1 signal peptidase I [Jatrophihabitans telluris]